MNPEMQKSILQMARGAIMERADYEMSRCWPTSWTRTHPPPQSAS